MRSCELSLPSDCHWPPRLTVSHQRPWTGPAVLLVAAEGQKLLPPLTHLSVTSHVWLSVHSVPSSQETASVMGQPTALLHGHHEAQAAPTSYLSLSGLSLGLRRASVPTSLLASGWSESHPISSTGSPPRSPLQHWGLMCSTTGLHLLLWYLGRSKFLGSNVQMGHLLLPGSWRPQVPSLPHTRVFPVFCAAPQCLQWLTSICEE